jgi:DNA-binding LacI/PurR family transcriptional regulator
VNGGVTLERVAALAGVSRSTVSRVVNGGARVDPATREVVERAILELGYVPNRAARSLVTRRTGTLALAVHETEERVFAEPFFAGVVRGAAAAAADADHQLVLLSAGREGGRDRTERFLFGGHVDGVVLCSVHDDDPLPGRALGRGLPTVLSGRHPDDAEQPIPWVDVDNEGGAHAAVSHLLNGGRRHLAVVTGPRDLVAARDRLAGARRACREAGRPLPDTMVRRGDFTTEAGEAAATALLARHPHLDAIVAPSDLAAVGVLRALHLAGRRVPDDVAVTGFDDAPVASTVTPALTTVHQDPVHLGVELVRVLLTAIAGGGDAEAASVVLPTHLVVRDST